MSTCNRPIRARRQVSFLLVAVATVLLGGAACNAVFGVDELSYEASSSASSSSASTLSTSGGAQGGSVTSTTGAGGGGGSVEIDPCAPDVSAGCKAYAENSCKRHWLCWPFWMNVTYGSELECVALTKRECGRIRGAPDHGITEQALLDCADDFLALSCGDLMLNLLPSSCVTEGMRANGQPCTTTYQCASTSHCLRPNGATCGSCTPLPKAGEPCTDVCSPGSICQAGACIAPQAYNEACDAAKPCVPRVNACINGVCSAMKPLGQACSGAATAIGSGYCDSAKGLYCANSTPQHPPACAQTALLYPGASCSQSSYCAGGSCIGDNDADGNKCVGHAKECEVCDATNGPHCNIISSCVAGLCEPVDHAAADCD